VPKKGSKTIMRIPSGCVIHKNELGELHRWIFQVLTNICVDYGVYAVHILSGVRVRSVCAARRELIQKIHDNWWQRDIRHEQQIRRTVRRHLSLGPTGEKGERHISTTMIAEILGLDHSAVVLILQQNKNEKDDNSNIVNDNSNIVDSDNIDNSRLLESVM